MPEENSSLLELLAEIEHDQWVEWSKNLARNERLSEGRMKRWERLWRPYCKLTEEEKEQDRVWARKVLRVVGSHV